MQKNKANLTSNIVNPEFPCKKRTYRATLHSLSSAIGSAFIASQIFCNPPQTRPRSDIPPKRSDIDNPYTTPLPHGLKPELRQRGTGPGLGGGCLGACFFAFRPCRLFFLRVFVIDSFSTASSAAGSAFFVNGNPQYFLEGKLFKNHFVIFLYFTLSRRSDRPREIPSLFHC